MCKTGFWRGSLKERNHLEDLGVKGRVILKVCSINRLEQHKVKERRRTAGRTAMELRVEYSAVILLSI